MEELYLVCLDGQSCWHPDSIWLTEEDANKRVDKILKDPLYEDIQPVIRKIKIGQVFPFPEDVLWLYKE